MIVRPAAFADADTILAWRGERAAWLAAQGQDQWSAPWPRWAVTGAIQSGQTWMVWDDGEPVASIALTAYLDLDNMWRSPGGISPDALWRPGDDPANAMYASKLMTPLARSGDGLGAELLDWAAGRTYDAGLLWLRLDAWTDNEPLHRYYERLGFQHVRTVASRTSGWCAQRASQPYTGHRLKMDR